MNDNDENKKQQSNDSLSKQAEKKRIQRLSYSEEKKEEIKLRQREYARAKRMSWSEEEKVQYNERQREYTRKKRMSCSEDQKEQIREQQRDYAQAIRMSYSEEQKEQVREQHRDYVQALRLSYSEDQLSQIRAQSRSIVRENRNNLSAEQLEHIRDQNRDNQRARRNRLSEEELEARRQRCITYNQSRLHGIHSQLHENFSTVIDHNFGYFDTNNLLAFDIASRVEKVHCVQKCQEFLNRTLVMPEEVDFKEGYVVHKSLVCVVCDCSITGTDSVHWIPRLLLKNHKNVLSYTYHYRDGINPILLAQYTLSDPELSGLLLSPRSRYKINDRSYTCCGNCYTHLYESEKLNKPPKYAISNGFAIGHLPDEISQNMTPLVNNLVAPIRAFNYFISFNGGKEHKITGNFTFFAQDVAQNIGALHHVSQTNNNPCVFIVLIGSFTQRQLEKIKTQGTYHVDTFKNVYSFLHANNDNYSTLPDIEDVPLPHVEQVRLNEADDIVENSVNPNEEDTICWKYWFPATGDPDHIAGTHNNQSDFARALFVGETPTLFYHPTRIVSHAKLSQLLPVAFPFGTGDVDSRRSPAVNEVECMKHYLRLSLPQFLEGQTILVIHHVYQRRKSFLTGIAKCNVSNNGATVANEIASVTVEDLDEAINRMKSEAIVRNRTNAPATPMNHHIAQLLKCIRTSCAPIGYTNEAASEARSKMFALWMTFGPPSLLFTFSPCDECSFKMQLHATMEATELPSLFQPEQLICQKLSLRKSLRVKYPGACAKEFDSLLKIVIGELLGWEGNQQKHLGIFGELLAFAAAVEEQGRTSLHGHIELWIKNYFNLQQQIFSKNPEVRSAAIAELERYLVSVLSGSFDITSEEIMCSLHHGNTHCNSDSSECLTHGTLQDLREMRHREYLKKQCGRVVHCLSCDKKWDTASVVNSVMEKLFLVSKETHPTYWPSNLSFPFTYEQTELMALRYQYDMIQFKDTDVVLKRFHNLLSLLFFNTHDWKHRKGCFKKGNECRFNIPHMPSNKLLIQYSEANEDKLFSERPSSLVSKWYNIDGTYQRVCSYEMIPKREFWDVFVNTNNSIVSGVLGYNNNICIGSINTLYYCTLYTSKSNQEDETYPYVKALEAVACRLRRVQQSESENDISQRQIGLRHLLSGISSHISSCVISATMAWYLVQHGSRFHFSHEFKPLLLSQFEAWYRGENYRQRIRHRNRRKKNNSRRRQTNQSYTSDDSEEETEVWMDSSVNNYINRPPDDTLFDNMCLWEYESKYDMITQSPNTYIADDLPCDESKLHYRFNQRHSGYNYCCLYKRPNECVPKLYYTNSIPDIESLNLDKGDVVEDHTLALREQYALKAMLMFFPFHDKPDLCGNHSSLWHAFTFHKSRLIHHFATGEALSFPHLYLHTIQILQNIQDLMNIKKVPKAEESLQVCTSLSDTDVLFDMIECDFEDCNHVRETDDNNYDDDIQVHHLTECVNLLSENMSIFNNNKHRTDQYRSYAGHPSIVSLSSDQIDHVELESDTNLITNTYYGVSESRASHVHQRTFPVTETIVSILTKALESVNAEVFRPHLAPINANDNMDVISNSLNIAITSLDDYALQHNLDNKQKMAFKAICSSFMLSFLTELSEDISTEDLQRLSLLLQKNGAVQQLLMCVTGPGGSGKSHVIKCCRFYCKMFCDAVGKPFNFSVFPITATTNAAAALLQGSTIHSAALLNKNVVQMDIGCDVNWPVTKILIIDEISMATPTLFKSLDKNLKILTGNRRSLYGGIHIVFTGDFMQLAPVQGIPIYQNFEDYFWHQCLNSAVFLDERNHRFCNDPVWGEILGRVQLGIPTEEDLNLVNERVLDKVTLPTIVDCKETKLVYGCYTNKKRNQITDACFFKYVSSNSPIFHSSEDASAAILIIKGFVSKQNRDVGPEFHKLLWALCGDDNLTVGNSCKIDPCLKLIEGIPLMVNTNTGKENRIVKGIIGNFVGVIWKHQCQAHVEDYHGYKVNCAYVTDIEYIVLQLHVDGRKVYISPEVFHPVIKFPGCNNSNVLKGYTVQQFPVNVSLAITGHKLQGMTVDLLILSEIHLSQNWLYVLLSRVTSLKGLYLTKPLKTSMFRPISQNLRRELDWLRGLETMFINKLRNV